VWLPTVRLEVVKLAVPPLSAPVPKAAVPSRKVTVPVAVEGVTVARRVTAVPAVTGLGDAVRVVVEIPFGSVTVTALEVLVANLVSPL
jgi:hypothetical protein